MSARTPENLPASAGRLHELAALGAQRAARALGELAGTRVGVGPLRAGDALKPPPFETGVLFEVGGRLSGRLGLFLDALSRRALVRLLLDEDEPEAPADMVASALCELANIVASQTVSAIADDLGGRISLSVPKLVLERAGESFVEARATRGGALSDLAFASELAAPAAELRVLLVFAPDV
jgi:chemotaxis protein CheY-P-specific phosphatase CheC